MVATRRRSARLALAAATSASTTGTGEEVRVTPTLGKKPPIKKSADKAISTQKTTPKRGLRIKQKDEKENDGDHQISDEKVAAEPKDERQAPDTPTRPPSRRSTARNMKMMAGPGNQSDIVKTESRKAIRSRINEHEDDLLNDQKEESPEPVKEVTGVEIVPGSTSITSSTTSSQSTLSSSSISRNEEQKRKSMKPREPRETIQTETTEIICSKHDTTLEPELEEKMVLDGEEVPVPSVLKRASKRVSALIAQQNIKKKVPDREMESEEPSSDSSSDESESDDEQDFDSQPIPSSSRRRNSNQKTKGNKIKSQELESSDSDSSEELFVNSDDELPKKKRKVSRKKPTNASGSGSPSSSRPSSSNSSRKGATIARAPAKKGPVKPWENRQDPQMINGEVLYDFQKNKKIPKTEEKWVYLKVVAPSVALNYSYELTMDQAREINSRLMKLYRMNPGIGPYEMAVIAQTDIDLDSVPISEPEPSKEKSNDSASSSEDEDDWMEMEAVDDNDISPAQKVQVTIKKQKGGGYDKDCYADYLRQEVNKKIRQNWENTHKAHILCYIAHLQYLRTVSIDENVVPSIILTQMPDNLSSLQDEPMSTNTIKKVAAWFTNNAYKLSKKELKFSDYDVDVKGYRYRGTAQYVLLATAKAYGTDVERAVLLFAAYVGLGAIARICVNLRPISRKWDREAGVLMEFKEPERVIVKKESNLKKEIKGSKKSDKSEKVSIRQDALDYWVEVYCTKEKRWICVNPESGVVDDAGGIEAATHSPICYVLAIDNKKGVRDITGRYASDSVKQEFRRRRTDPSWLNSTLNLPSLRADKTRADLEDSSLKVELIKRPLPTTMADYKNHPLYVLEKDLLKFEGIYPPPSEQKPLGEIRGHKVFPRSTVYTLQSANNWEKMARSVKAGEKPYKVVKARPTVKDMQTPKEDRITRYLDLFGHWQTEPYKRPEVIDGKIPVNQFGNVYAYLDSMIPLGTVHLRLPGLLQIAHRLRKECVPAVVGWECCGVGNFPTIEGCVVLEDDVDLFVSEWKKTQVRRAENQKKKREDRVLGNWRKLIRGVLRLKKFESKFGVDALAPAANETKSKKKNEPNKRTPSTSTKHDPVPAEPMPSTSAVIDFTQTTKRIQMNFEDVMKFQKK